MALLGGMSWWFYFSRPTNMAFHDLTANKIAPPACRSLLGLSLNFIPTPRLTNYKMKPTLKRFKRDLEVKAYFAGDDDNQLGTPSKLYVPSKWTPPPWDIPKAVDQRVPRFARAVKQAFRLRRGTSNLLPFQHRQLARLQRDKSCLTVKTDKNLGPGYIEHEMVPFYAKRDHLGCKQTYKRLTKRQAVDQLYGDKGEIAWGSSRRPSCSTAATAATSAASSNSSAPMAASSSPVGFITSFAQVRSRPRNWRA